jgi:hypothetical protein
MFLLRRIEKLIRTAIHPAKALFHERAPVVGEPCLWRKKATAGVSRPVFTFRVRPLSPEADGRDLKPATLGFILST